MAASSPACQPTHNQNNRLATSTSSGMELAQPQSQASSASITSAAESAAQKLSARGLEHDVQGLGGGRGGSGALSGVDTSAEYTMFMSAEDEPLGAMEDFGSLEPHHMEGSDNEHDHYNEGEASGAEGGAEREGKGRGPYRKRRKDSSGSVKGGASSSGECGTAEAEKAKARYT